MNECIVVSNLLSRSTYPLHFGLCNGVVAQSAVGLSSQSPFVKRTQFPFYPGQVNRLPSAARRGTRMAAQGCSLFVEKTPCPHG